MKRWQILTGFFVILIAAAMFIPAGGWLIHFDGPYEGQVLDDETGEPIEGAAVVAVWNLNLGFPTGGHNTVFFDAKEVVTDKNGEFSLSSKTGFYWWPFASLNNPVFTIYKPGFDSYPQRLLSTSKEAIDENDPNFFKNIQIKSKHILKERSNTVRLIKAKTKDQRKKIYSGIFIITPRNTDVTIVYKLKEEEKKYLGL